MQPSQSFDLLWLAWPYPKFQTPWSHGSTSTTTNYFFLKKNGSGLDGDVAGARRRNGPPTAAAGWRTSDDDGAGSWWRRPAHISRHMQARRPRPGGVRTCVARVARAAGVTRPALLQPRAVSFCGTTTALLPTAGLVSCSSAFRKPYAPNSTFYLVLLIYIPDL